MAKSTSASLCRSASGDAGAVVVAGTVPAVFSAVVAAARGQDQAGGDRGGRQGRAARQGSVRVHFAELQ